jgi:hypothetical protein
MIKFLVKFLFLAFAFGYIGLTNNCAQDSKIPSGWKKVSICDISFFVPKDLKNENAGGVDSCVALFSSSKIRISIDYGMYGSSSKKYETSVDFKEEFIKIDGKKTQLATYRNTQIDGSQNFIARIYVVLNEPKEKDVEMTTSLNMTIAIEGEKDLETAKQIFQSIRFSNSPYTRG